jgi:hypothetical protein
VEQKGLRHYQSIAYWGDSCFQRKLCISKTPRSRSAVSARLPSEQHPQRFNEYQGVVITNSMPYTRFPTDTPTRARISIFGSRVTWFCKRPVSTHRDTTWSSTRRSMSKGGTGKGLLIVFLQESRKSTSSVSTSRLRPDSSSEQKPQEPKRTSWPQEKGCSAISPDSCASHPLHSYVIGYDSRLKYDVPRDWLCEACHMARVHWESHCKGFRSKEGPHYQLEQSVRNQLECDQVQRALEKLSGSCLWQETINLIHEFGNPLWF